MHRFSFLRNCLLPLENKLVLVLQFFSWEGFLQRWQLFNIYEIKLSFFLSPWTQERALSRLEEYICFMIFIFYSSQKGAECTHCRGEVVSPSPLYHISTLRPCHCIALVCWRCWETVWTDKWKLVGAEFVLTWMSCVIQRGKIAGIKHSGNTVKQSKLRSIFRCQHLCQVLITHTVAEKWKWAGFSITEGLLDTLRAGFGANDLISWFYLCSTDSSNWTKCRWWNSGERHRNSTDTEWWMNPGGAFLKRAMSEVCRVLLW